MDRISGLPEDVISHILSFLCTKSFVQTSVIAKGWKFHWAHVPFFGFTCNGGSSCTQEYCNNNINTFHTSAAAAGDINYEFELWITDIFKRNVRNLVIRLDHHQLTLPHCLFTCKTLVDLCIVDCIVVTPNMDAAIHFPALQKLQLVGVGYDSKDFLTHLFSGCPVLEELIVERMTMYTCRISSPTLTRLVIDTDTAIGLKLDTPALRYFRLRVSMTWYIIALTKLSYLVEAHIHLNKGKLPGCAIEFLCELWNVNCLTLSTPRFKISNPVWFSGLGAKYHNLTELKMQADWRFINLFLENAYNLQVLTLGRMADFKNHYWTEPKQVPPCLISKLENIYLVDFEWSMEHEFNMVKYILKNAKILKKMEVIYTDQPHDQHHSHKKLEVVNRFVSFERGSQSCCIVFV